MSEIRRLPGHLVDKIAAGEVVERPASVVKELVENALDAGARTLRVEVEAGGKSLVRVRDDGAGMSPEDAALSVERHATSKLRRLEDLQEIATNGFRGEALAAIASVSRLRLATRRAGDGAGTEVEVRYGQLAHVREAGHPRGTTVEVADLFGALPARRKFLRADTTESSHVAEAVTLLALASPAVGFTLSSRGRALIEAPPVGELGERVYQLFGPEALHGLVPVEGGHDWARVAGFVTRPAPAGSGRANLRLFVNGRPVRDRGLARALAEGFKRAGLPEARGDAFLFVSLPPSLLDVNVHPAKTEVRFAEARVVWEAVSRSVGEALARDARARVAGPGGQAGAGRVAEAVERYLAGAGIGPAAPRVAPDPPARAPGAPAPAGAEGAGRPEAWLEGAGPQLLGQHRNTYLVASDGEELLRVDQHTAHERVRFERIVGELARRSVQSQRLLVPAVVRLPPTLLPLAEEHAGALAELGFEIEPFGGGSLRIGALPAALGARDPGPALAALLRELAERAAGEWMVPGVRERLAATLACHSSARAGDPLPREQMAAIVRDLMAAEQPAHCPHGRPTFVRIPREDVSRWFGRAGWKRQ